MSVYWTTLIQLVVTDSMKIEGRHKCCKAVDKTYIVLVFMSNFPRLKPKKNVK